MGERPRMPTIDLSKSGFRIDGVLVDPLTVTGLTAALGRPRIVPPDAPEAADYLSSTTAIIWDELGLRTSTADGETAQGLEAVVSPDERVRWSERVGAVNPFYPSGTFTGEFTIGGTAPLDAVPIRRLRRAYLFLRWKVGDWQVSCSLNTHELEELHSMDNRERLPKLDTDELADMVRAAETPFTKVGAYFSPEPPVRKPSGTWKLPAATEPSLELRSFPFRLAIVQELMYRQDVLEPRFDVHDFAQDRGAKNFDPMTYVTEMIPSVRAWFRKLPIPARLAGDVEELLLDGGNDVYLQLIPQWDGEDDRFTIKTLTEDDLAPFTNLKRIHDFGGFLGPRARRTLERRGVEIH